MDDAKQKPKRKSLSKKVRFEVFKRDSFSCQYCGASAPEVLLHVDHIKPVSKGGTNRITNLITACLACNSGKGDRELSDASVVSRQKAQLDSLQDRREQIEMIMSWHEGMKDIADSEVSEACKYTERVFGYVPSKDDAKEIRLAIKRHGLVVVLKAIDSGSSTYSHEAENGICKTIQKLDGICSCIKDPELAKAMHIRNIMYKKSWIPKDAIQQILDMLRSGISYEDLKSAAHGNHHWDKFCAEIGA